MAAPIEPLLTVMQVAKLFNVHPNTVKRLPLPFYRITDRGDRRYRQSDIDAWLNRDQEDHARHDDHLRPLPVSRPVRRIR
jgi:hypothetical protein